MMKNFSLLGFLLISLSISKGFANIQQSEMALKRFDTDFCTAWPEGTKKHPMLWAHCCVAHDLGFWIGGNKKQKKRVDLELKSCVSKVAGPIMGQIMFVGVQLGYLSPIKGPNRWGWGWKHSQEYYRTLSEEENDIARETLMDLDAINPILIDDFIDFRFNRNDSLVIQH